MLLILETPEEEEAIRQGTISVSDLMDRIETNNLNPNLTIGVDKNLTYGNN